MKRGDSTKGLKFCSRRVFWATNYNCKLMIFRPLTNLTAFLISRGASDQYWMERRCRAKLLAIASFFLIFRWYRLREPLRLIADAAAPAWMPFLVQSGGPPSNPGKRS